MKVAGVSADPATRRLPGRSRPAAHHHRKPLINSAEHQQARISPPKPADGRRPPPRERQRDRSVAMAGRFRVQVFLTRFRAVAHLQPFAFFIAKRRDD
jgi:hypothetical protein